MALYESGPASAWEDTKTKKAVRKVSSGKTSDKGTGDKAARKSAKKAKKPTSRLFRRQTTVKVNDREGFY